MPDRRAHGHAVRCQIGKHLVLVTIGGRKVFAGIGCLRQDVDRASGPAAVPGQTPVATVAHAVHRQHRSAGRTGPHDPRRRWIGAQERDLVFADSVAIAEHQCRRDAARARCDVQHRALAGQADVVERRLEQTRVVGARTLDLVPTGERSHEFFDGAAVCPETIPAPTASATMNATTNSPSCAASRMRAPR